MTAIAFYLRLFFVVLLGRPSFACDPGWYVNRVRSDGSFRCGSPWPQSLCDTVHGCSDEWPETQLTGALACPLGFRALATWDGRGVYCGSGQMPDVLRADQQAHE